MISNMEFIVKPAYAIEDEFDDKCSYVIVSNSDKYDELAERINALVLHFADTEDKRCSNAVTEYDVKSIVDFLNCFKSAYTCISCDERVSRSPAIVAGLFKCTGRDDSFVWRNKEYRPNVLVYRSILEYCFPHSEVSKELMNIVCRSPEEYRYFRRNGKDLEYDKIIYRDVCGSQICYGCIYGSKKQVVLFVKVGREESVFGYNNKYINMASHMSEKYGITVIVSSNPFCSFKWREALEMTRNKRQHKIYKMHTRANPVIYRRNQFFPVFFCIEKPTHYGKVYAIDPCNQHHTSQWTSNTQALYIPSD